MSAVPYADKSGVDCIPMSKPGELDRHPDVKNKWPTEDHMLYYGHIYDSLQGCYDFRPAGT